jgi:hypothetical protein
MLGRGGDHVVLGANDGQLAVAVALEATAISDEPLHVSPLSWSDADGPTDEDPKSTGPASDEGRRPRTLLAASIN